MLTFRYFVFVGSALLVLLFVSDAYFGDNESDSRFNGSFYERALYAPHQRRSLRNSSVFLLATSLLPPASGRCSPSSSPTKVKSSGKVTPRLLQSFSSDAAPWLSMGPSP
jgi:hypothetical protein